MRKGERRMNKIEEKIMILSYLKHIVEKIDKKPERKGVSIDTTMLKKRIKELQRKIPKKSFCKEW